MTDSQHETYEPQSGREALRQIDKGDTIAYLLPPSSRPSNPLREWHGRVEWVGPELVRVTVLDEGYTGETEFVMRTEIVSVTGSELENPLLSKQGMKSPPPAGGETP